MNMHLTSGRQLLPAMFLLIGANAWCAVPSFNILDYGARNDGSAPATQAINSAIQAAKAAGGGTVYVPAGKYVTGPIELVSNLVFHIAAGATLRFPAEHVPLTKGRHQGIECMTPVPLIGGRNLENVTITGRGTITTDNAEWVKLKHPVAAGGAWERLLQLLEQGKTFTEEEDRQAALGYRPSFIRTMDSKNVLIDGIHIVGSPMWAIDLLYSDNVVVRDVIIENYNGSQADGIGVDSSRNVRISNCYIDTGDDGFVLKSGKDSDGLRVNRPTENVSITNCTVHRTHGAVTLGSETSGGIRNVVASNIVCQGSQMGVRIKSRRGRGGVVEGIRFENWTMDDVGQAINLTNYYSNNVEVRSTEKPVATNAPLFRNIAISNMTINRARVAINIEGLPEMPVDGMRISNVIASAKIGMKAYNTVGLELHNVQVNAESGPAFLIRDSKDLELDAVATRKPLADMPVIRLDRCPGAIVRGSRTFAGTGTFLSVASGELQSIVLAGNTLGSAQKATEEVTAEFWQVLSERPTEGDKK